MKFSTVVSLVVVAAASGVEGFQPALTCSRTSTALHGYVPSGFTEESYKKFREEEKKKLASQKNLGRLGPKGFQSRSMRSFQEALERGEAAHLMPMFNAKAKIARGEIKMEDIPYMQRGGAWDNSDVKGAKKKRWLDSDKTYAAGGFKKEQSVSIFGGDSLDWTGRGQRRGPESVQGAAPKFSRNYKPPNVNTMKISGAKKAAPKKTVAKNDDTEDKPKKRFGMF